MAAEESNSEVVELKLRSLIYRLGRVDERRSSREKIGRIALLNGRRVVVPGIPGLRAVPDLVTIHQILPLTVHIHL